VLSDGSNLADAKGKDGQLVLPGTYHRLLRYLVVATCEQGRERASPVAGLAMSKSAAGSLLSGEGEVQRAISILRSAFTSTGEREPIRSKKHSNADASFIRSLAKAGPDDPQRYAFVLEPGDNVDWIDCRADLEEAGTLLGRGDNDRAYQLAHEWEEPLATTTIADDLDAIYQMTGNHIISADDVVIARLRARRILTIAESERRNFGQALFWIARMTSDPSLVEGDPRLVDVYDGALAEAAVRARFAIDLTRDSAENAIHEFFRTRYVTLTTTAGEFNSDLESDRSWDDVRAHWLDRWRIEDATAERIGGVSLAASRAASPSRPPSASLVDVLTPGFTIEGLEDDLGKEVDPEIREKLLVVSGAAVDAVEQGDFFRQEELGRDLVLLSGDLPHLAPVGHYFVGEGLRLQADLQKGAERNRLLAAAIEEYETSRQLDPQSVRATRGLARTYEVLGDYEEATRLFQFGYSTARQQVADADDGDPQHRLELSHEVLRVTRHYVHCLATLRDHDQVGFRLTGQTESTLHRLTLESGALHRERLPLFGSYARWSQIEWFMGLTLLAKSYVAIGDHFRASQELCFALMARRAMLSADRPLTPIEAANLRWWLATAGSVAKEPVPGWFAAIDQLGAALSGGSTALVFAALDEIERVMRVMLPPSVG
jgi:hypothetical protein